jgi:hypothetical protein
MNPTLKSFIAPAVIVLVLGAALFAWYRHFNPWHHDNQPTVNGGKGGGPPGPAGPSFATDDFDTFQSNLAKVVSQRFNVDPATVVVAPAAYNLGWLLNAVEALPDDQTDCVPAPMPSPLPAPHLFPSYKLGSNIAATMTLGSDALQQLTSASLNLSHSANLTYSIDDVQVLLMDGKTVESLATAGPCSAYVASHPKTRLIRGLVLGKISFSFTTDNPASAQAKLPKLGGVSANVDPNNSSVIVADNEPSQILEMVSVMVPATATAPATAAPPNQPLPTRMLSHAARPMTQMSAHGQGPTPVAPGTPHIYFQQDSADAPGAGAAVAAKLHQNWPNVVIETKVERIPSAKMPSSPQVRFFNAADQDLANQCRDHLKAAAGIDARVVRIGLAAPAGQLEVWLQKVNP